ncbi:MAG: pyridoxal-phosphate dependent enzyme [Alphaproteobacteria bacterium]
MLQLPLPAASVIDLIGKTPMLRVRNLDTGPCELYLKLENQNPGGSIKDRVALALVEAAEKSGGLQPGGTLVEATAGNAGLGLALIAGQRGYKLKLVIPDKMSQEKIFHLRALGAEIILTRSDVTKGHPEYYHDRAQKLAETTPGAFYVNQFANPANPAAHENSTAPEIWQQMEHRLDAVICGVGTGGTMTGLGRYFARVAPHVAMVLADPAGSILAPLVTDGTLTQPGSWLVEGIGEDFVPLNCDLSLIKQAYTISDAESIATAHDVLQREGVLCGSSSGTLIAAALRYCRAQTAPQRVVTFVCDSGNKYLSKIFNEYWLDDHGLADRPHMGDLRDLIARPFIRGTVITAAPSDTLQQVHARMRTFDVAQLPVMRDGKVVGIIAETDILLTVSTNDKGFDMTTDAVMSEKLVTIDVKQPLRDLLPVLERGLVGCVMDRDQFLGLVTPMDFLNFLRKRTGKVAS